MSACKIRRQNFKTHFYQILHTCSELPKNHFQTLSTCMISKSSSYKYWPMNGILHSKPKRTTLILGKDKRLTPRFAGPFKILKKIGNLAYRLDLPSHVKAHPVFHVTLLKKYVTNANHVLQETSRLKDDGTLEVHPEIILDRRSRTLRNCDVVEILIKWDIYPIEDATGAT